LPIATDAHQQQHAIFVCKVLTLISIHSLVRPRQVHAKLNTASYAQLQQHVVAVSLDINYQRAVIYVNHRVRIQIAIIALCQEFAEGVSLDIY